MRNITPTEPRFGTQDCQAPAGACPAKLSTRSALQTTRDAIARWTGVRATAAPARDASRVSPQARFFAQAQLGLAEWIGHGGFSQPDILPLAARRPASPAPVKHGVATLAATGSNSKNADACVD